METSSNTTTTNNAPVTADWLRKRSEKAAKAKTNRYARVGPHKHHKAGTTIEVNPAWIETDTRLRTRLHDHPDTVRSHTNTLQAGVRLPPITLARINGWLFVADGWHRLKAAKEAGFRADGADTLPLEAIIRDYRDFPTAHCEAYQANLTNGLPLNRKEKREAFRVFVRARRKRYGVDLGGMSYSDLTRAIPGVATKSTMHRYMKEDFKDVAAAMARLSGNAGPEDAPEGSYTRKVVEAAQAAIQTIEHIMRTLGAGVELDAIRAGIEELHSTATLLVRDDFAH